jgi:hypothetical protein
MFSTGTSKKLVIVSMRVPCPPHRGLFFAPDNMEEATRVRKEARSKVVEYFDVTGSRLALSRAQLQELLNERWDAGLQVIRLAVRRNAVSYSL